jgi:hypothetical protein
MPPSPSSAVPHGDARSQAVHIVRLHASAMRKRDLLVILIDDLRYDAFGTGGRPCNVARVDCGSESRRMAACRP